LNGIKNGATVPYRTIAEPKLHETQYRSPQLPLWQLGDGDWLKVVRLLEYATRHRERVAGVQEALPLTYEG